MDKFKLYLKTLEERVMLPMFENGDVTTKRLVTAKPDRLHSTGYGATIGSLFPWDIVCAVDYYGMHKKTVGFLQKVQELNSDVSLRVPVLSFASIHLEHIIKYCPSIITEFPSFKLQLIELRGLKIPRR